MHEKEISRFCRDKQIELLVVFGSCAADRMHKFSDIDLAVKFEKGAELSKLELLYELDEFYQGRDIDLVVITKDTDPLLLYEILFNGKVVYEKSSGVFIEQKLRAWKLYIDTAKLRKLHEQYLKQFSERSGNVT